MKYLEINTFCELHEIDKKLIFEFESHDLVHLNYSKTKAEIPVDQISNLEKYLRIYNELQVNVAGIDVIFNLLQKMEQYQNDIKILKGRLRRFEE